MYDSNFDTVSGFPLPPIIVRGIAPDVTVIPVQVLSDDRFRRDRNVPIRTGAPASTPAP